MALSDSSKALMAEHVFPPIPAKIPNQSSVHPIMPPDRHHTRLTSHQNEETKETNKDDSNRLAPYQPTHKSAQIVALSLLKLTDGDVFFDLGCGDGRMLLGAFEEFYRDRVAECGVQVARNIPHVLTKEGAEKNNGDTGLDIVEEDVSECRNANQQKEKPCRSETLISITLQGQQCQRMTEESSKEEQIRHQNSPDIQALSSRNMIDRNEVMNDDQNSEESLSHHDADIREQQESEDRSYTVTIPHLMRSSSYESNDSNGSNEGRNMDYNVNGNVDDGFYNRNFLDQQFCERHISNTGQSYSIHGQTNIYQGHQDLNPHKQHERQLHHSCNAALLSATSSFKVNQELSPSMQITPVICNRKIISDHVLVQTLTSLESPLPLDNEHKCSYGGVPRADSNDCDDISAMSDVIDTEDEVPPPPPPISRLSPIKLPLRLCTDEGFDCEFDSGLIHDIPATITASFSPGNTPKNVVHDLKHDLSASLVNKVLSFPSRNQDNFGYQHGSNLQLADYFSGLYCVGIEYNQAYAELAMANTEKVLKSLHSLGTVRHGIDGTCSGLNNRICIRWGDVLDEWSRSGEDLMGNRRYQILEDKLEGSLDNNIDPCSGEVHKYASNLTLLNDATAIFVYLLPDGLKKVKPLLLEAAKRHRRRCNEHIERSLKKEEEYIKHHHNLKQMMVQNGQFSPPKSIEKITHRKGIHSYISDITDYDSQDITIIGKHFRIRSLRGDSFDFNPDAYPSFLQQDSETENDDAVIRIVHGSSGSNELEGETSFTAPLNSCKTHRDAIIPKFRIVSYMFRIPGWKPAKVDRSSKGGCPLYLYEDMDILGS